MFGQPETPEISLYRVRLGTCSAHRLVLKEITAPAPIRIGVVLSCGLVSDGTELHCSPDNPPSLVTREESHDSFHEQAPGTHPPIHDAHTSPPSASRPQPLAIPRPELEAVLGKRADLHVVTTADGAHDNWRYLDTLAPQGTSVVDFYHAAEKLKSGLDACYGQDDAKGRAH